MDWEFGISRCKLICIEWVNKVLLYSTENYVQHPVINHNGTENEKECMYIYVGSGSVVKNLPAMKETACSAGDVDSISGSGRSPREGNVNPLQDSCLGNPTDTGIWQATVHRVTKSLTWLSD